MKKFLLALALVLFPSLAWAQNPTCPTRPPGDNSNACASTSFVQSASGSGSTINPKNLNTIRFASQYGQADWCMNLIAALADLGSTTGTIIIDVGQSSACAAVSTIDIGANHRIEFVSGSAYALSQTLKLGIGSSIIGTGGGPTYSGTTVTGTTLRWTGAVSGDMVLFMNTLHGVVRDINLDCNLISDCAPIHYDSTNSNLTSQNTIENVTLAGGHYGLLVGLRGTTHPTTAQCNSVASQPGCYEMDLLTFRNFQIFGNCADLTAEGIHINSYFALQQSTIGPGNIQCANIAIRSVFSAGPNTTISNVAAGSVVGVNPVGYQVDAGGGTGFNLSNFENEGAWTYSVHDSGCSGSGTAPATYSNNGFTAAVLLDGCGTYVTFSNTFLSTAVASGTTTVFTSGEVGTTWTTASSGVVNFMPSATNPLPNASLANPATTVNGQTCTLGSTCTITAAATSIAVGTTTISSGTSHGILTNNAGLLGNTAAGTNGQIFLGVTGAEPAFGTMSGAISITNTGVASLGSFTSANLAAALTNETGAGIAVFNSVPSIINPVFQDFIDNTKQFQFDFTGIATGTARTWAVPNNNDTFVGLVATQELTNKTLNASVGKGTWTASGTWTLPAFTIGGTISGGGNQLNNIIIGTATPLAGSFTALNSTNFISSANTGTPATGAISGTVIQGIGVDTGFARIGLDSYATVATTTATLNLRRARGTAAVPTAVQANDILGILVNQGYAASGFDGTSAFTGFIAYATETHTGAAQGSEIAFVSTPNGSLSNIEGFRLLQSGLIKFTATSNFTANGSVATVLGSVGATGAHTTVQEWLTFQNASGTVRYVPAF